MTSNRRTLFLFFHALRSGENSKILFSLKILKSYSFYKLELEITGTYQSRPLSSLLPDRTNSIYEEIVLFFLLLICDKRIRGKLVLDQINSWIESLKIIPNFKGMQTYEIDECAQIIFDLPKFESVSNSEEYYQIIASYFDGTGLLHRAIQSWNGSVAYNLVNFLSDSSKYKFLEWEMKQLLLTHESFSHIAPEILPHISEFTLFYSGFGWYPEPDSFEEGQQVFQFTFQCFLGFRKSIPLSLRDRNQYVDFLRKHEWNKGLLYKACETGKHANINWAIKFLKKFMEPSLIWEIEPLDYGKDTIVTALMSSGSNERDIYRELLQFIAERVPFRLLWDHFNSENCPISWIAKSQLTETEKFMFNREFIQYYTLYEIVQEIFLRYNSCDAIRLCEILKNNKIGQIYRLESILSSDRNQLFTDYEARFRRFLVCFIQYLLRNLPNDISTEKINKTNKNFPMSCVFDLIHRIETTSDIPVNKIVEAQSAEIESIEKICSTTVQQMDFFENLKNLSTTTVSSDLLCQYTSQLGLQKGILNAAWSTANVNFVFGCIRNLLQFPNILLLELMLFNNSYIDVSSELQGQSTSEKIRITFETLFHCQEGCQPINFIFDAAELESCLNLSLKWNSYNFLVLLLYPSSSKLSFTQYIGYDPDLYYYDKIHKHEQCLRSKFYNRGLIYRACETLQPDNIKWAIDFLGSIDKCLVETEMIKIYETKDASLTNMLIPYGSPTQTTDADAGKSFDC